MTSQVLTEMNARREPDADELDVEGTLGQLTNVNKVHVACRGAQPSAQAAVRCGVERVERRGGAGGRACAQGACGLQGGPVCPGSCQVRS